MKYKKRHGRWTRRTRVGQALTVDSLSDFSILDPDVNFSDHLPIRLVVTAKISNSGSSELNNFDQSIFIQR